MTATRSFTRKCIGAFALCLIATLCAGAQSSATGSITGTVVDASGAAIPGATVVITDTDTGAIHNETTHSDGSFTAPFLQSGHYEVVASAPNFSKLDHKGLTLTVGQLLTVDSKLTLASVSSDVMVTTAEPLIDTQKVESSQTITETYIDNLPVNSRRWDTFVLLTANVAPDGASGLVSFRGINGLYNSNMVDGVSNQQALFAEARGRATIAPYVYSPDSIKEFQSENSGYSAEFGNAAGGVVNAITKSGGNAIHGDLFYYIRYPSLNAIDPYNKWSALHTGQTVPSIIAALQSPIIHQQQQFGGSVSGPIKKDKLFYFFTYDGFRRAGPVLYVSTGLTGPNIALDEQIVGTAPGAACPASVGVTLCTNAVNFLNSQQGGYKRNIKQDIFFPKLDWQPTEKDHVSLSYLWGDYKQPDAYAANPTYSNSGVSTNATYYVHSRFLVGSWDRVLNSSSANSLKGQWSRDLETTNANGPGPSVTITGNATYGEATGVPRIAEPDEHRLQIFDTVSHTQGKHTLKAGVDFNLIHEIMIQLFQGDGVYNYTNFTNWVTDVTGGGAHWSSFAQTIDPITGDGKDDFWSKNLAFFAEDSWKAMPKLTVSAGIRYDLQLIPQPTVPFNTSPNGQVSPLGVLYTQHIPINHHMVSPRLGFAYNPFPKTVVRGGYGLFFANVPLSTYYNVRVENGKYQGQYNFTSTTQLGAPTNTNVLFVPPGPALAAPFTGAVTPSAIGLPACAPNSTTCAAISFHGMDPHFTNPYTHSFDLAVEQQLTPTTSLTLAYTGTRGMRLPYAPDRNVTPWTGATRTYDVTDANGNTLRQVTVPYYPSAAATGIAPPSPNDGNISVVTSNLNTWYNAFSASLKQQMKYGVTALANYTWSHTEDGGQISGSGGTFYGTDIILDPYNRKNQYPSSSGINMARESSNSDIDMRGRFVGSLVYASHVQDGNEIVRYALSGWTVTGTFTAQNGFPITAFMSNNPGACNAVATSGANITGCGNIALAPRDGSVTGGGDNTSNAPGSSYGRDPFDKRNGFRGPGVHNLDMRISRDFNVPHGMRFQILAEAFNVVNHRNGLAVATVAYSAVNPSTPTSILTLPTNAQKACPVASHANSCIIPYQSNNTGTSPATLTTTTPFGTINSTSGSLYGPRQLQFSAKLFF